jgi:hypothetical protein
MDGSARFHPSFLGSCRAAVLSAQVSGSFFLGFLAWCSESDVLNRWVEAG